MKWTVVPLRKIARVESGFGFPRDYQGNPDQEYPFFKVNDMNLAGNEVEMRESTNTVSAEVLSRLGARACPAGTIIFPKIGAAIGTEKKRILVRPSTYDNNMMGVIPERCVESRFLYYWLLTVKLQSLANIGPVPSIRKSAVEGLDCPLPPPSERRRIVEILDQADRLRRLRAEADAKAERILPALFIKMFGDPATNPMGWTAVQIRDIVARISRRDPGSQPDTRFVYIDIAGVDGQCGLIVETRRLLGAEAPSRARQVVKANDVVVSTVRPYLRATALVRQELNGQVCSTGFCVLRAKDGYGFGFLYALSRLSWFTDQLNARARGGSYPAVTDGDVLDLRVPRPNDATLLRTFDSQVLVLLDMGANRRVTAAGLENLFASLLRRAFTGELTASWGVAHMKELLQEMMQQERALAEPR